MGESSNGARSAESAARPGAARWLAAGAVVGLALAAGSLILGGEPGTGSLPGDAVARVNETTIRRDDYLRLLQGLERDTREPLDEARRRHVLDRMIDEELLVQRGLEMGLAQVDRRVRADLTGSLIGSVVAEAEDASPDDAELSAFYAENSEFFASSDRLRVQQVFFRVPRPEDEAAARVRADAALDRLRAGEPLSRVRDELGDAEISPVPDAMLPPAKLREYLGPTALRAVMALEPGAVSEVVRSGVGLHVIQLSERDARSIPELAAIRAQVEAEWRRRTGERALREYLDDLRDRAHVVVSDELP